jgi:uncharacterized protein (DUF2345 family)
MAFGVIDYSKVTNQNTLITFLRQNGGVKSNTVFGWYEDNIPNVSPVRSDRLFSNKDLIIHGDTTVNTGDTLGKAWVSLRELSGDSWWFHGNKWFRNGFILQNGTYNRSYLSTAGDSAFMVNTTAGGMTLLAADNINIIGDTITQTASGDLRLTSGDSLSLVSSANIAVTGDTIGIYASGDLRLTSGDSLNLVSTNNVAITGDTFGFSSRGDIYLHSGDTLSLKGDTIRIVTNSTSLGDIYISSGDSLSLFSYNNVAIKGDTIGIYAGGDLRLTSGDSLNLVSSANIAVTGDTITQTASGDFYISSGDSLKLTGTNRVDISSANGNVKIESLVIGGDSISNLRYLSMTGTPVINTTTNNLTISTTTSGNLSLSSADDVSLTGDTMTITAQGDINITGDTVTVTSNNFSLLSNGHIRLNNITANEIGDTTSTIANFAGAANGTAGVFVKSAFAAYKVYNAVWNDYAEGFEYDLTGDKPIPGYVYKQTEFGLIKTNSYADRATIGVYSDTAGMVMGSKDCITEVGGPGIKIPIALAGKVKVWIHKKIKIGDLLVSGYEGFAENASLFVRMFKSDRIIGKALENSKDIPAQRIWMLVK